MSAASAPLDHEVARKVKLLNASFASGKTRSRQWRVHQLNQFLRMLREGRDQLCAALQADLHKSPAEGYLMEIGMVEQEIKFTLAHLDDWMKPTPVPTNLLNFPGSSWIYHDPLGVVLIIGAWNYPVQLSLMPLVGAIAGGNCTLVKLPSDGYTSHTSATMARLLNQYLDPECILPVEGDRHATQAVLRERFGLIFYTGGAYVGEMVAKAAAQHLTPTILELGGKSPCIVDKTASLQVAAKRVAWAAYLNCGQTCIRPDYLLVHEDVADQFVGEIKKAVADMYGDSSKTIQKSEFYGRLVNARAWDRVASVVSQDRDLVVFGGADADAEAAASKEDKFIAPTLIDFGKDFERFKSSAAMADEIFGPVLPMYRWSDLDEVIGFIVAGEKPLSMYTFTETTKTADRILAETSSGSSHVNDTMLFMSNHHLPFGGVGRSGMGHYHGKASFEAFTHSKSVVRRSCMLDMWARYPPYDNMKLLAANVAQFSPSRNQALAAKLLMFLVFLVVLRKSPAAQPLKQLVIWLASLLLG